MHIHIVLITRSMDVMGIVGRVAEWLKALFFKPDSLGSIPTRDTVGWGVWKPSPGWPMPCEGNLVEGNCVEALRQTSHSSHVWNYPLGSMPAKAADFPHSSDNFFNTSDWCFANICLSGGWIGAVIPVPLWAGPMLLARGGCMFVCLLSPGLFRAKNTPFGGSFSDLSSYWYVCLISGFSCCRTQK